MYDIIVSGYYGFHNSGDDAILHAIINNLRSIKQDIKIMVLSKNPEATRKTYGVDSIDRFNIPAVIKAMKKAKLFLNGGGNLIQDVTSTRSLLYYLGTIYIAKSMGLKIMLYANGIGPVYRKTNRYLTSKIINLVDTITLREESSKQELEALGIRKPEIIVTADPALGLAPASSEEIDSILAKENISTDSPLVCFSIRKWPGYERYSQVLAQAADYMAERYNIMPVFLPMHFPSDLAVAEDMASRLKHPSYILRNKYDIFQTLGIVSRFDLVLGMRLHALIYAVNLSVPVIGLIYDPKVQGFLEYVNQPSAVDVADLDIERLKALIDDVWNRKDEIKSQLKAENAELKRKALQNAEIASELLERNR
ncbi:MAG: polysaccharide pyruvyl transferase CsaB [Caulobacteraceae bacterium]